VRDELDAADLLRQDSSRIPALRLFLANSDWSERAALGLQQAGLRLKVSEYLLLRFLTAALVGLLAVFLTRAQAWGLFLALLLAVGGFMLPAIYVRIRREQRSAQIGRQLPEALQLISNGLRSGFAFTQSMEVASKQLAPPLQAEFQQLLRDTSLGSTQEDALQAMVARAASHDLDMAVTAIVVQRTTGGNLAEILDNVMGTMREREHIRGEIRALTASQRLTGLILSLWPLALGLLFFLISPSTMSVLFTEPLGRILLSIAASLQVIGFVAIRRVLVIDI